MIESTQSWGRGTHAHTHAHTHTLKKAANAVKSSENRWKSLLCANLRAPVARPDYPSPCSDRWNYGRDGTGPIASSRALSFSPFFFLRLLFVSPPARLIVESQSRPTQSRCAVTELVLFFTDLIFIRMGYTENRLVPMKFGFSFVRCSEAIRGLIALYTRSLKFTLYFYWRLVVPSEIVFLPISFVLIWTPLDALSLLWRPKVSDANRY